MEAHPDDLATLLEHMPPADQQPLGPSLGEAGLVLAFLHVCRALEPGLVLPDSSTRSRWLQGVSTIEFRLRGFEGFSPGLVPHPVYKTGESITKSAIGGHDRALERDLKQLLGIPCRLLSDLVEVARACWRGPGSGPVRALPFVRDPALRAIAERDLRSLDVSRRAEETKMCLVLAGSVVEAMLVDLLEQDSAMYEAARAGLNASLPQGKKKVTGPPADLDFFQLIEVAGPGGLKRLADRTCKAAHLLRDTRNFVHPTREREETKGQLLRSQEEALAAALVEMVLADLAPRSTA